MKFNRFVAFMAIGFRCFAFNMAWADNPVVHISAKPGWISTIKPYDKRPAVRNIENGYYMALVERQIDVERQADYRHNIREIVSEAGIQNGSQLSVSFDPSYEQVDFHQLTVWRNGKPQNRLNPGDFKIIADESDFSRFIYQGSYSANYIIPDIRKGDRIEYAFTITGRNPVFGNKYCDNIYLQGNQVIAHQYVSLQAAAARNLYIKPFNKVPVPIVTEANGTRSYVWENYQVLSEDDENSQPRWYNPYAYVAVSQYKNWAEVIDWALKVNPVNKVSGALAQRVAKLKAEAGGDKEKYFRLAVKTAQDEVRYMGIEIGEYSHRANHPENVFNQRYGDCKDKALLLASMLRADGIDAYMVLVNTNMQDKIAQLPPTTDAFNHAVVVATLNGRQIWIDATIAYQRGKGADLYFPNYGKGLELKAGNNALVDIPLTKTGKIISREKYTITGTDKKVRLDVKTTYTLNQADDVRSRLAGTGMHTTEKNYLKYYAKIYPKITARDSLLVQDNEEHNELTTIESYLIPDFFKKDTTATNKYTADFYADAINEELPSITTQTKNPVNLDYPYAIDHTIEVILPNGWDVADKSFSLKREAYSFESSRRVDGNSLLLNYKFAYLKDFLPVNQLEQARKDISLLKDSKLSYGFSYSPNGDGAEVAAHAKLNLWMVLLGFIVTGLCVGAAIWVYHIETPAIVFEPGASFMEIGGWLVIALIMMFAMCLSLIDFILKDGFIQQYYWDTYLNKPQDVNFKTMIVWEVFGYTALLCASVFCLVLMLNKRDIFARVFTVYCVCALIFFLTDFVASVQFTEAHSPDALSWFFFYLVFSAVWVPYFLRSERAQQTFIVPYPPYNFSYEK